MPEDSNSWVDCPEAISGDRFCDAPAEIIHRQVVQSTHGPIVHVKIRCARGHILTCPLAMFGQEAALAALARAFPPGRPACC